MTPTSMGEGKTTTTIGLAQALNRIGKKAFVCIREPSLGPVMGLKGGAAGGGHSQVLPMEDINLHLTGDMHIITSAHNLLAAMLYNHIYQGNELDIDEKRIIWLRTMDMNDRALRGMFDITASSEVMAIMCLSKDLMDMREKLGKIIVAYNKSGKPITASDLKAAGAMALLMHDSLKPNLVQTIENTPAFVHGGPFANIAHGCNSLQATKLALKLSDYVVTEAGFGTDLGAEKFFDIKCRVGELKPEAAVLVVTQQAITRNGYENVAKHIENIKLFGVPLVVAVNKRKDEPEGEINYIIKQCESFGVPAVISSVFENGGKGGIELAKEVVKLANSKTSFNALYESEEPVKQKIEKIATKIYGADGVNYSDVAERYISFLEEHGMSRLPICIAKTQSSLSDDPKLLGRPKGFRITIRDLKVSNGAGFIVAYAGNIMTMPGLPRHPAAENMDITPDGKIIGLF
jgi:formate--tetrahydrofolate ligase